MQSGDEFTREGHRRHGQGFHSPTDDRAGFPGENLLGRVDHGLEGGDAGLVQGIARDTGPQTEPEDHLTADIWRDHRRSAAGEDDLVDHPRGQIGGLDQFRDHLLGKVDSAQSRVLVEGLEEGGTVPVHDGDALLHGAHGSLSLPMN